MQAVVCKGGAVLCRLQYVKVGVFYAGCSMQKWGCVMQAVVCKSGAVLCRL